MAECIFCRITAGDVSAHRVAENGEVLAVLDIFPHAKGHTVVMPKAHVETVLECSPELGMAFFVVLREAVRILNAAFGPDGFTIGINHGTMAGQAVPHLHAHIIPRYTGDGGGSIHSVVKSQPDMTLDEVAAQVGRAQQDRVADR